VSRIVSVNLAVPEPNPAKGVGVTGISKRLVDHLVTVRAPGPKTTGLHSGLVGDQIFETEAAGDRIAESALGYAWHGWPIAPGAYPTPCRRGDRPVPLAAAQLYHGPMIALAGCQG
jgi:hypothetical protein